MDRRPFSAALFSLDQKRVSTKRRKLALSWCMRLRSHVSSQHDNEVEFR